MTSDDYQKLFELVFNHPANLAELSAIEDHRDLLGRVAELAAENSIVTSFEELEARWRENRQWFNLRWIG